ncbi:MAG TPA: hypothetical protein VN709_02470 [Terriglobales bacterium]|nr:hypothetical protein [Terriglobales bacterium]
MNELRQALDDIAAIRGQVARAEQFRGYGPLALGGTAALAVLAGAVQKAWVPKPMVAPGAYAYFWSVVAAAAAALIAIEGVARTRRLHQGLAPEMIRGALEKFLPAAAAGLLLTMALVRARPADAALLPGLWQILFALGVFASCRFLPRATLAVAGWYLAAGLASILASGDGAALAPWRMAAPFAAGQSLAALVLWRFSRQEANDGGTI